MSTAAAADVVRPFPRGDAAGASVRTRAVAPLVAVVLVLLVSAWLHRDNDGLWYQGDSPRHLVNGEFWREFLFSGEYTDPKGFALDFYSRYPAIAPTIWPPFVYLVEATGFTVTGPSIVTARLIVLALALLGAVYLVRLLARWGPDSPAAWAAVALVAQPMFQRWTHAVMMDIPALALGTASVFHFDRAMRDEGRRADVILALVFLWAGTMTRLTTILLPAGYVLAVWVTGGGRRLFRRDAILLAGGTALAIGAWLVVNYKFGGIMASEATSLGKYPRWSWENWTFYPAELARALQPWFLPAALAGAVAGLQHAPLRRITLRLLLAAGLLWVMFSLIALKESRYIIIILPLLTGLIGTGVAAVSAWLPRFRPATAGVAGLALASAVWGVAQAPVPRVGGFRATVADLNQRVGGARILYDGRFDGVFTAYCLVDSPRERPLTVLRGAKVFYATSLQKKFGLVEMAQTEADVVDLVSRSGTRWLLLEREELMGVPAAALVRDVVRHDARFRAVRSYPITSENVPLGDLHALDLYEYVGPMQEDSPLETKFPVLNH